MSFCYFFKVENDSNFEHKTEGAPVEAGFVFGQNMRDRAKV